MWFTAEFRSAEKGDVEETRDVVRPEVGAVGFSCCDLGERKRILVWDKLGLCAKFQE